MAEAGWKRIAGRKTASANGIGDEE
jgi:hypothetical protein